MDINLPKGVLVTKKKPVDNNEIIKVTGLPCIVKPNSNGSSFGVTLVEDLEMLEIALQKAFELDNEILVEEFIHGTEITSGVFKTDEKEILFPLTEIVSKNEFFDTEASTAMANQMRLPLQG